MSGLRLSFLGVPLVELEGEPISVDLRKALALLVYLAVTGRLHSRDSLAALFWPELSQSRARAGLRYALAALRKALGEGWLHTDRETAGLGSETNIWVDVTEFRGRIVDAAAHDHAPGGVCGECLANLSQAVALYRGDFLRGFTLRDCPDFDEWQYFQSEGLRHDLARVLERLAAGHGASGDLEEATAFARRWLALDRLEEAAYRELMRLYVKSGQRAAALRQYEECCRVLAEELGAEPEKETTELWRVIKAGRLVGPTPEERDITARSAARVLAERYERRGPPVTSGAGELYSGWDLEEERDVAILAIPEASLGPGQGAWLVEQMSACLDLRHPRILATYDVVQKGGEVLVVTEPPAAESLRDQMAELTAGIEALSGPDAWEGILTVGRQVNAALAYAQGQGVTHRDLRPENILLGRDGAVKVAGYGLAPSMAMRLAGTGGFWGGVEYVAPELALNHPSDVRADLYSLGAILYELATGHLPFAADDPVAVVSQHVHAPPIPARMLRPGIPPALDGLIAQLLAKDPESRPPSAETVLKMMEAPDLLDPDVEPTGPPEALERIALGRLVGRAEEMRQARRLWARTIAGHGRLLMVGGEAGIGKTRLARELATQVQVLGGQVLSGSCHHQGGVPYAPFSEILWQALGSRPPEDVTLPSAVLGSLLALAPALRLQFPDVETGGSLDDPQLERHRLFESLSFALSALSERNPLLLIVEDMHWADSGTLYLLRHLARHSRTKRMMFLVSYRRVEPEEAPLFHELLLDLDRERLSTSLALPRLDREQTRDMLAALFAQRVPGVFLEAIHESTEGNPFFIEEVCKALVGSGKLRFAAGRWSGPSIEELGIPQSVRVAIQSRVRVLPVTAQDTLRLAAVLGRTFDLETLVRASTPQEGSRSDAGAPAALTEDALFEALDRAERAQLIEPAGGEGDGVYTFVHSLVPSTLVDSLGTMERRRLHHRAAIAIEATRPDDHEALAHHHHRAGHPAQAARHLLQAGDRARALYAHEEAIRYYQQALEILKNSDDLERAARTMMKLGLTHHNAFDFQAARRTYREGFSLWQRVADGPRGTGDLPPDGVLRITALEPASLSPGVAMDHPSAVFQDQLFSGLVEVSPDLGIVPDVAQRWQVLDGGRRYVFYLRDNVLWSDGVPVTAHDFEYAWKRALEPGRGWLAVSLLFDLKGARAYYEGRMADTSEIGVKATDDHTLSVELEGPTSYFPYLLAFSPMFPVPRHLLQTRGADWTEPGVMVTNGPFCLADRVPGERISLVRNPRYHGRFTGNVERIECMMQSGSSCRHLEMYDQGELDICGDLPPAEISRARHRYAEEYVSGPKLSVDFVGFDLSRPPFDAELIRRAFVMGTNRETMAHVSLRGHAFPATGGLIPPGMPGHSPGIGLPYDPGAAAELMAAAGYPGGRGFPEIACIARDDPGHNLMCSHLQAEWREHLGITIEWEQVEWVQFPARMADNRPHLWMTGWWADYPDPDDYLRVQWWISPAWQNPTYQRLVEDARRFMEPEERLGMYREGDRILVEEAPLLPLTYLRFHCLVKPWVRRYRTSPLRWWFWKDVIVEPH